MLSDKPQSPRPTAFEPCQVHHVLQFCMRHPPPHKHLIICSTRDAFLQDLLYEVQKHQEDDHSSALDLLAPTLSNLHNSRGVQITFCPDLANLRAYLVALMHRPRSEITSQKSRDTSDQPRSLLIIMNPVRLHENTLSYSAQGFNRTFASAVDVAHHLDQQLIMVECIQPEDEYEVAAHEDENMLDGQHTTANPWDHDLSMLNITTKTFGGGERGWVGRSVKVRQVARRWFEFRKLEERDACPA